MTYKSSTVKQRVKSLLETIIIIGDQLKPQENIPDYLKIYEESNLFMLVLVTLLISGLDYSMSPFRFCSSNWLNYDGLASIKNKSCEKTYYFKQWKARIFNIREKKKFNERKMECPPKKIKMNIDGDFPQLNKKELNR